MSKQSGVFLDELAWRGLIHDSTDLNELRLHLNSGRRRFYIGFDPTAPSLTIGNLLPITLVIRGAQAGLDPVVLFGGGTGLIGDPSGKSTERNLLEANEVGQNVARHQALMAPIFERALGRAASPEFLDNSSWLATLPMIDFLRDVGKHFGVAEMSRRESVRRRLTDAEVGLTYTEFSYSLLQAYDFLRLRADHNVTLQMGASDQWGNIVAGIDYVRRVLGQPVYGLTCPLLLRSDGSKFGKSEKGAVWLSPDRTSPYSLFQFLLNLSDEEARRFALFFSLEPREQIEKLLAEHAEQPGRRQLQRQIAQETTTLVHGQDACEKAIAASAALFSGQVGSISREMLGDVFADVPTTEMALEQLAGEGLTVLELLISTGLAASRREARGHLQSGAVLINGDKAGLEQMIRAENLLHDSVILLRRGKREWRVIRFSGAR